MGVNIVTKSKNPVAACEFASLCTVLGLHPKMPTDFLVQKTATGMKIVHAPTSENVYVPVKPVVYGLFMAGKLQSLSNQSVFAAFKNALEGFIPHCEKLTPIEKSKLVPKETPAFIGIDPAEAPTNPTPKVLPLSNENPVPLRSAKALNLPVVGTSAGSVYHTILLGKRFNVAARVKGKKVSVRVESLSNNEATMKDQMGGIGLSYEKTHYSLHVEADTDVLKLKVLGAILMCLSDYETIAISHDLKPLLDSGVGKRC